MKKNENDTTKISKKMIDEMDKVLRTEKITDNQIERAKAIVQKIYQEWERNEGTGNYFPKLIINKEKNEITINWIKKEKERENK